MTDRVATMLAEARELGATSVRSWPHGDRLTVDLHLAGTAVPGFHLPTAQDAREAADRLPGARAVGRFLLQPDGVDARLTDLTARLAAPGARLVAHRPGRRAVIGRADGSSFTKVVRAGKQESLVRAARAAQDLPLPTPTVIGHDRTSVTVAALPGASLHTLLRQGDRQRCLLAAHRAGGVLAALHRTAVPAGTTVHGWEDELRVTRTWEQQARMFGARLPERTSEVPGPFGTTPPVLLHRDLHDKQILVDPGSVGFIDFDLLCAGDAALDLANLIEHLDLRREQGLPGADAELAAAVIDGYGPDRVTRANTLAYRALTRRRLVALHHFRWGPDSI